jgi:glycosyltransferase involved in cell wall biosynthesis
MDDKLKILHVANRLGNGGSESGTVHLACAQSIHHTVQLVGIKPPLAIYDDVAQELLTQLKQHSIQYHQLHFSNLPLGLLRSAHGLLAVIKRFKPDVVHLHTDHPEYLFAIIKPWVKALVVRTIRNTVFWPTSKYRGRFTERSLSQSITAHFTPDSIQALNHRRAQFGLPPPINTTIVPNAINRHCEAKEHQSVIDYQPGYINLGYIGRLTYQKALDILLEALKALPSNSVALHIIGDGEDKQALEKMAKSIPQTINFYGAVPYARQYIKEFDYLVVPSRYEGFGLISLEGQIEKTPVIAARSPGLIPSLPNEWPLMFDNESSEQLAELLQRLITQQEDMSQTIEIGFENALSYTMEAQVDRYTKLYHQHL